MIKYTHRKKLYHAVCIQWMGDNTPIIIELLYRAGCEAHVYGDDLMLRWKDRAYAGPVIDMMKVGHWLRLGENDVLKIMTPEEFKLKYEEI